MREAGPIRTAAAVGICAGTLLGAIEGLRTLSDNFYLRAESYAIFYVGGPLLVTTLVSLIVTLLIGALLLPLNASRLGRPARVAGICATGLVWCATLLLTVFWLQDRQATLGLVGSTQRWLVWLSALAVLGLGALIGIGFGIAEARLWDALGGRGRALLTGGCIALNLIFVPMLGSYWLTEGKGLLLPAHDGQARQEGERNVLLVTLDTVRADRVGAYRPDQSDSLTPAIDEVAREGVLFENAISSSSWTLPSLASLLTGEFPREHGAGWSAERRDLLAKSPLREGPTLARVLAAHGYFTQAVVTNPYLSLRYGLAQGFQGYENLTLKAEIDDVLADVLACRALAPLLAGLMPEDRAEAVTDHALDWLRDHQEEKFLLWVHFIDPHAPYTDPRPGARTSFRGDTLLLPQAPLGDTIEVSELEVARLRAGEVQLTNVERAAMQHLHDLEVSYVDAQIGRLMAELETLDLADDTIIAIASDHGEEFWDHGGVEHGHTLYDELLRVPLVLRGPGLPHGKRFPSVVRLTDVAPTLLALLELPPLPTSSGVSLLGRLAGEPAEPLVALSESLLFAEPHTAVRTDELKYIQWPDGREELYDLREDPAERNDRALCGDTTAARALHAASFAAVHERTLSDAVEPDPAIRSGLRALGYVD